MKNKLTLWSVLLFLLSVNFAVAQSVSGVVSSTDSGEPLPGVAVSEKGTNNAVLTDFDGKFTIKAANGVTLVFSSMGTETQEVVATSDFLQVSLKSSASQLNEVVVTALGMTREKKSLGYATQDVDGAAVTTVKDANFVNSLSGKYITAEDVGMETRDMDIIREVTPHVTGISESKGGSGNPSPVTAYGVYMGMKAAANYKFGTESLEGKKILVQGVGHVGETLVKYITEEGAQVIINDINEARLEELSKKYHTNVILGNDIYNLDLDIYAPCALGATINDETIHQLNTKVIAGAANNQLADEVKHGRILKEKGIAYAPDFLINAGGIINVYGELEGYTKEESIR